MALSRWPLPCFAAVRIADALPLGEDWARMLGRVRSVVEELKVWESQPERRFGRSPMREVEAVAYRGM